MPAEAVALGYFGHTGPDQERPDLACPGFQGRGSAMSRRRTVSMAVVVLAALASGLAPSVRAGSSYDYTTGGGHRDSGGLKGPTFAFSAHNGPQGPSGEYTRSGSNGSLRFTADIT